MKTLATIAFLVCTTFSRAAEIPTELPPGATKVPVPKSPYIAVVYKFADTMLEKGRSAGKSLMSELERKTLSIPDGTKLSAPEYDENFLRLLYTLSELTLKPTYRAA